MGKDHFLQEDVEKETTKDRYKDNLKQLWDGKSAGEGETVKRSGGKSDIL